MSSAIMSRQRVLLNSLIKFYRQKSNFESLAEILNGKISLRVFDKFVTQYSVKHSVMIPGKSAVYDSYHQQLDAWSKRMFDPFGRSHSSKTDVDKALLEQFDFTINGIGTVNDTTIGQLNFFRWIIQNNIHGIIESQYSDVRKFIDNYKPRRKRKATMKGKK